MDPNACREHVASILELETQALGELTAVLAREHDLLVADDVAGLESAMTERQHCVGKILRLEDERRSLCRMLGHATDALGLANLLAWCDPTGSLQESWAVCTEQGAKCRRQNDRNAALVNARLKRVETLLGTITGRPTEGRTYGRRGAYAAVNSGRIFAVEA